MAREPAVSFRCQGYSGAAGSRDRSAQERLGNGSLCPRKGGRQQELLKSTPLGHPGTRPHTQLCSFSIAAGATKLLWSCWQRHLGATPGPQALRCEVCSLRHLATCRLWQAARKVRKAGCPSPRVSPRADCGSSWGVPAADGLTLCFHSGIHKMHSHSEKEN